MDKIVDFFQTDYSYLLVGYLIAIHFFIFFFFRMFIKKAIVNNYDPLNINYVFFVSPALTGYVVSPVLFGFTKSYFVILFFIFCLFFLLGSINSKKINLQDETPESFQVIILFLCGSVILLHLYFNMVVPGTIPLFMENGVDERFSATQNSRFLSWSFFAVHKLPIVFFAFTQYKKVRKIAILVFLLDMLVSVLFASKGAILGFLYLELFTIFISKARGDVSRFLWHKKRLVLFVVLTVTIIPAYFLIIGFAGNNSDSSSFSMVAKLIIRFFGGFDQLIPAAAVDMTSKGILPVSVFGLSLVEYQLLPFFKSIFSLHPEYSSVGQYVVDVYFNKKIEGAFTFPNSNLILECIFTSGLILGFIFYIMQLAIFYIIRSVSLSKEINIGRIICIVFFVYNPLGLFMSGQEWWTNLLLCLFYLAIGWLLFLMYKFLIPTKMLVLDINNVKVGEEKHGLC